MWWDSLLWELGYAVCHQQPDRILRFGGDGLFVCSRDTGIFVSFFTLVMVLSFVRGREGAGTPPWPILVLGAAGVSFMAWDGLSSYLGLRESTNTLRLLSGFAAGAGLAFPVAALLNRSVFGGDRSSKLGSRPGDLCAAGLAGGTALALFLWRPEPLFRLAQVWLLAGILGTFWTLNLLLVYLLRERDGVGLTPGRAAAAAALTLLELAGSYWLHRLLAGSGPAPVQRSRGTPYA